MLPVYFLLLHVFHVQTLSRVDTNFEKLGDREGSVGRLNWKEYKGSPRCGYTRSPNHDLGATDSHASIRVRPSFLSYRVVFVVGPRGAGDVDGHERQDHLGEARRAPTGKHQVDGGGGRGRRGEASTRRQGHGELRDLPADHRSQPQRQVCGTIIGRGRSETLFGPSLPLFFFHLFHRRLVLLVAANFVYYKALIRLSSYEPCISSVSFY